MRSLFTLAALAALVPMAGCDRKGTQSPAGPPWFEDATAHTMIDFDHESGHAKRCLLPEAVSGGCCMFDYDGDGRMDLYFVQAGPLEAPEKTKNNRLFRNRGDGTFEDVTARAGVGAKAYGMGCTCGDYDGDGDTDLFVTNLGPDILYRNDGNGTFADVTAQAGVTGPGFGASAAFVDYDEDGDLDLFVTQYVNWTLASEIDCPDTKGQPEYCKPDNYQAPALSILYRNAGNGTFEDVSRDSGIAAAAGNGLGIACGDFNGDGHMDFYVANDGGPNRLWINDGKHHFTDQALIGGCAVSGDGIEEASMGVAAVDLANNGRFDLFVTNLVNETVTLYRDLGNAMYEDGTAAAGLAVPTRPFTGFGLGFFDFDHDGMLDLFVANGRVTKAEVTKDNLGQDLYAEPDQLFRGVGPARFEEVFPRGGTKDLIVKSGRAAAFGDLDDDGDVDAVLVNRDSRADVLSNVAEKHGNAVRFRLLNAKGSDAIGALVRVTAGDTTRSAWLMPSYGYCSCNDPRMHFGIGAASQVSQVVVRWPGGKSETFGPFPAGALHVIKQGSGK